MQNLLKVKVRDVEVYVACLNCQDIKYIVFQSREKTGASFANGRRKIPDDVSKSDELATASLPKCNFTKQARG